MSQRVNVKSNSGGYSLVEVLVAMAILAVVSVALMQSSLLVIQKNVQNEIRDEAVRLMEQRMNEIRSNPGGFDNPDPGGSHLDLVVEDFTFPAVTRMLRGATVQYSLRKVVTALDANNKQVTLTMSWLVRGQSFSYSIMSIMRRYGM